jgi:hypothetical protein
LLLAFEEIEPIRQGFQLLVLLQPCSFQLAYAVAQAPDFVRCRVAAGGTAQNQRAPEDEGKHQPAPPRGVAIQ